MHRVPIEKLLPGELWEVSCNLPQRVEHYKLGDDAVKHCRYLVLLTDGTRWGWKTGKDGCSLYMSIPYIGDLTLPEDVLWRDLRKLRDQHPPYFKNYVRTLDKYRGCKLHWERQVDWR